MSSLQNSSSHRTLSSPGGHGFMLLHLTAKATDFQREKRNLTRPSLQQSWDTAWASKLPVVNCSSPGLPPSFLQIWRTREGTAVGSFAHRCFRWFPDSAAFLGDSFVGFAPSLEIPGSQSRPTPETSFSGASKRGQLFILA